MFQTKSEHGFEEDVSLLGKVKSVLAEETGDGTAYTAEGVYDVIVPCVIVNQICGRTVISVAPF